MISKTTTGIQCFDAIFGGSFQGRPMLLTGKRNAGKTIFGLQFINQGILSNERGLMLSLRPAQDLAIYARGIGLNVDTAVDAGELFLLEYNDVVPGRDREDNITLPPEGFAQLMDIINNEYIRRIVIDTVVPWIVMTNREHLPEHIFSFVRAFERLGITCLFTCSHPASPAAQYAHKILESNVPVAVTLSYDAASETRNFVVNKYIGASRLGEPIPYQIENERGIICDATVAALHQQGLVPQQSAFQNTTNRWQSQTGKLFLDSNAMPTQSPSAPRLSETQAIHLQQPSAPFIPAPQPLQPQPLQPPMQDIPFPSAEATPPAQQNIPVAPSLDKVIPTATEKKPNFSDVMFDTN